MLIFGHFSCMGYVSCLVDLPQTLWSWRFALHADDFAARMPLMRFGHRNLSVRDLGWFFGDEINSYIVGPTIVAD